MDTSQWDKEYESLLIRLYQCCKHLVKPARRNGKPPDPALYGVSSSLFYFSFCTAKEIG
jgi:hypothetical protein